ncbi:MAG: IclR family transcriptional regulator [Myxococcales bacterium]|nr:IclR family transcriptional regulator [Myxococcales bacterium]
MTKKPKSDYAIQTVSNALRLLEMFEGEERLGVTELSRRLELHKNNVFRLLATLEQAGYIEQCAEDDQYRLGVRCLELGHSYSRSRSLLCRARPVLEQLAAELGETAHLGVEQGDFVAHMDGELPDQILVTSLRQGTRLPLHTTALGKVLLAFASDARRESFDRDCVSGGLEARTPDTVVDRDKLFEQLRTTAAQGFAVEIEECEPGLACAAAPVYDGSGQVVAGLSVSAPTARVDEDDLHTRVVPAVQAAAMELSRQLGFAS